MVSPRPRSGVTIGRERELAALADARRRSAASRGGVVVVTGEAGVGKTRLIDDFFSEIGTERRARHVVRIACRPEGTRPFGLLREIFVPLAPHIRDAPPLALRAAAQIAGDANAFPLELRDLVAGAAAYIDAVARARAVVIAAEDVHWADGSSLGVLAGLASEVTRSRVLIVATLRSEALVAHPDARTLVARLRPNADVVPIDLQPLTFADTRELVARATAQAPLPPVTLDAIAARSGGNPFFAEQLVASAVGGRDGALPATVRAAIDERLALLQPGQRDILRDAAVLGERNDAALVAEVANASRAVVEEAFVTARAAGIVEPAPGGGVRFVHDLIRLALVELRPPSEIRAVHARLLARFERAPDPDRVLPELAYHAWLADERDAAVHYNRRLGERAYAARAVPEAIAAFERVLACEPDVAERATILESLGTSLQAAGELERALDVFESALEARLRRDEFDDAARVAGFVFGLLSDTARSHLVWSRAAAFLDSHATRLGDMAHDALLAFLARFASAAHDGRAAAYLAAMRDRKALAPRARANAAIALLNISADAGDIEGWRRAAAELEATLPDVPPFLATINAITLAQSGIDLGANAEIERALLFVRRLLAPGTFAYLARFARAIEAAYDARRGRCIAARTGFEATLGPDVGVAGVVVAQAAPAVAIALGDETFADHLLALEASKNARDGDSIDDALMLAARAELLLQRGEARAARADLQLALSWIDRARPVAAAVLVAAANELDASDAQRALALVRAVAHTCSAMAALADHVAAIVAARFGAGDVDAARRAADAYRRLGWRMREAEALELAGAADEARRLRADCTGRVASAPATVAAASAATDVTAEGGGLSKRQREIARLVAVGRTNAQIARDLGVGEGTIEKHLSATFEKLGIRSRVELAARVATAPERYA